MERVKKIIRYLIVNLFRKLPHSKYKLTKFYKSKTRIFSYLFVFTCLLMIPIQFSFYFFSSMYYFTTNFKDSIEATTPVEQAAEYSKYNTHFSYTFKEGFINRKIKDLYKFTDVDLLYKNSGKDFKIESKGLLTYNIHGQDIDIYTMKIDGQQVLAGIPEYLFNECVQESNHYPSKIPFLNRCSRIMFMTLSLVKFDPMKDKVKFKDGKTIEIFYSDGKTLDIEYGEEKYVREFYNRSRGNQQV